ncbi:TetR family transcriptional regulator [Nocardioides gansuensis]|uniref:TetR family transcriptional regulator n=1 Tax=Nocardioides gansuensis TaxID=2138300 RepID=A0A2T8F9Z0_9ACTN|nr:TetR family transcriptional regulator [Nocardioides gansuensis]PVG82551.1 TetR family transcriptional regulator [Nocardioides gansuensis]
MAPTGSIRDRLVVAATELTTKEGWAAVTMSRLADMVGVSRQTVYNEIGTKPALAEAMILEELSRFLAKVDQAFLDHPGDLSGAIEAAVVGVLRFAEGNALLHAVVSATHGADTELLPLLTTHAGMLMGTAKAVIAERLTAYELPLTQEELAPVIDAIVRIALSHVMQPSGTPEETAAGISWIARRVLGS